MKQPIILLSLVLSFPFTGSAQHADHLPGDFIVMLAHGADASAVCEDLRTWNGQPTGLQAVKLLSAPMRTWLLHFDNAMVPEHALLRALERHPQVMLAQYNHVVHDRIAPNDPQYGAQWQHVNIDSELAWDITTGGVTATGDTIVVCVVENADLPHPDLVGNAWFNHFEIPNNGIDEDGNGYTDDFKGWNPGGNDDDVYGGSHGTSVAGMIGARGNNGAGVAGANWNVKIMVVTRDGISEAAVVESYTYPWVMRRMYNDSGGNAGAFVVATNSSWGIDNADHTDFPIWCAMYDSLGSDGILSCGATANNNVNIDVVDDMPTGCESDFMISVTATNNADMRTFSGYGATTIDVGAPGADIFTTTIGGGYGSTSGTSFASPLTAGVIGLLYSAPCASLMDLVHSDPEAGALYIRQALFNGVELVGNLPGNCVTGGRINSYNSLQWILDNCGACPGAYNLSATSPAIGTSVLAWQPGGPGPFNLYYHPLGDTTWTVVPGAVSPYYLNGLDTCAEMEFAVEVICDTATSGLSDPVQWTTEGCCVTPSGLVAGFTGENTGNVSWTTVLGTTLYEVRISVAGSGSWFTYGTTNDYYEFTGLVACTDYEVQVRSDCGGTPTPWSASVVLHTTGCGACLDNTYCPSISASTADEWIERVQLATLDNTSGDDGGYGDYTGVSTPLDLGGSYAITLTPGYSGPAFDEYFTVYIDLDHDGDLNGPGELVFDPGTTTDATITGSISVPLSATPGVTRMRVIMRFFTAADDACEDGYDYGETEDYCVELIGNIGMDEAGASGDAAVLLFPQPASDRLAIEAHGLPMDAMLSLLDNTGRLVVRERTRNGRSTLDVSGFSAGAYTWRIEGSTIDLHGRLLIAR